MLFLASNQASAEGFRIFDGSGREILYETSSHAGHHQLEEVPQHPAVRAAVPSRRINLSSAMFIGRCLGWAIGTIHQKDALPLSPEFIAGIHQQLDERVAEAQRTKQLWIGVSGRTTK